MPITPNRTVVGSAIDPPPGTIRESHPAAGHNMYENDYLRSFLNISAGEFSLRSTQGRCHWEVIVYVGTQKKLGLRSPDEYEASDHHHVPAGNK